MFSFVLGIHSIQAIDTYLCHGYTMAFDPAFFPAKGFLKQSMYVSMYYFKGNDCFPTA
jgi:hypothetical protein